MAVPQSTTPNPNNLKTHDARFPDANPQVGGPYLYGHDPAVALANGVVNSVPSHGLTGRTWAPAASIKTQWEHGDQPGVAAQYHTEDHAE